MKLFGITKVQGSVAMAGTLVFAIVTAVLITVVIVVKLVIEQQAVRR